MKHRKLFVFTIIIIMAAVCRLFAEDTPMIADVIAAQEDSEAYIETMSAVVTTEVEFEGQKRQFSYDYVLQIDENGNKKMLVTNHGTFQMQYLVDTSDNSVTILMGDGSKKKYTLTEEQKKTLQQMAGLSGFGGATDITSMFAKKDGGIRDAKVRQKLKTKSLETDDMKINIKGRDFFNKDSVYVEYDNKEARKLKDRLDEKLNEAELGKSESKGGKLLKERFIGKLKRNRDKMLKYNQVRRVEKINMKNGLVEEQDMYNEDGKRLSHMWVKDKKKVKVKIGGKRKKAISEKLAQKKTDMTTGDGGVPEDGPNTVTSDAAYASSDKVPEEKEIELVTEAETEMETVAGNGKMKMKMKEIIVNEPVVFKWAEIKLRSKGKKTK